jgi:hypothetical protein
MSTPQRARLSHMTQALAQKAAQDSKTGRTA